MNRYTIYCTPEQTKKALELGAPIHTTNEHLYRHPHEYKYWVEVDIQGNLYAAKIPTAEQMIGWLEEQFQIEDIDIYKYNDKWRSEVFMSISRPLKFALYSSRKEATLAAIDAALEYLLDND